MVKSNLRVLISTSTFGEISGEPLERLHEFGAEYQLNPHGRKLKPAETVALLQNCNGIIAGTEQLDRAVLAQAPSLQVISRCGTGLDNVDLNAAAELGIQVMITPGALADAVSELALGGILDLLRRISAADRAIRQGLWEKPMGAMLRGKTVGIIGLGRVGKQLARLLRPFDVKILASDPCEDESFAQQFGIEYVTLDALLRASDIVTLHLSYTPQVYHLLDKTRLSQMKESALLVNCARGGLVDEAALYDLMRQGQLAGAYLDNFETEPYAGPLAELSNVLMTPHMGSYARECRASMELEAVQNLIQFFQTQTSHSKRDALPL